MKSTNTIEEKIEELEYELQYLNDKYSNLDQIAMQGKEGDNLKNRINEIKGSIEALKWTLNRRNIL